MTDDILDKVPGIPPGATDEFDVTASGVLSAADRKILRYLLKLSFPDLEPSYLIGLRTVGEIRALGASRPSATSRRHDLGAFSTSSVYMRPIMPVDHEALYFAALEPSNAHRWRFRGRTVPFPEFTQSFGAGSLADFAFAATDTNALVAYCSAYNYDPVARHATFAVQRLDYDSRFGTAVIESIALFLNYLFTNFHLRKAFAEIPEYNFALFGLVDGVFAIKGRKSDYYWHGDRYWDEVTISTSETSWMAFAGQFFGRPG